MIQATSSICLQFLLEYEELFSKMHSVGLYNGNFERPHSKPSMPQCYLSNSFQTTKLKAEVPMF